MCYLDIPKKKAKRLAIESKQLKNLTEAARSDLRRFPTKFASFFE